MSHYYVVKKDGRYADFTNGSDFTLQNLETFVSWRKINSDVTQFGKSSEAWVCARAIQAYVVKVRRRD